MGRGCGRLFAIAVALVPASLAAGCGETPPAPRGQGPGSYWSTDMTPVRIWFRYRDPQPPADRSPDLVLPRAYVKYALPNQWPTPKVLPDEVREAHLGVGMFIATDTGEALPVAAEREGTSNTTWGYDRARYAELRIYVGPRGRTSGGGPRVPPPRPGRWTPGAAIDEDGYVRVPSPNGLYEVTLCGASRQVIRDGFCGYSADLTPRISILANFADYRGRGGLPYAETVLSMIKATICKYNDCSQ